MLSTLPSLAIRSRPATALMSTRCAGLASQHAAVLRRDLGQDPHRLGERLRQVMDEGRGLHAMAPSRAGPELARGHPPGADCRRLGGRRSIVPAKAPKVPAGLYAHKR